MTAHIHTLFDEDAIAQRVGALAEEIAEGRPQNLLVVAVLKGSFIFAADLVRAMHRAGLQPEMEFIHLSSYGAGTDRDPTPSGFCAMLKVTLTTAILFWWMISWNPAARLPSRGSG